MINILYNLNNCRCADDLTDVYKTVKKCYGRHIYGGLQSIQIMEHVKIKTNQVFMANVDM